MTVSRLQKMLSNSIIIAVKDIIINPTVTRRYDKLKFKLIRRLTASHEKKVRQLLTHEELETERCHSSYVIIRTWQDPVSNRVPRHIQTVLAS